MKRKSIAVILIIVALACACVFAACESTIETPMVEELSSWMSMIEDDTLVTELVIPGTHDSGTLGMVSICETQNKDFAAQLAAGARYFDVRLRLKGNGDIVFYHTFSSKNTYDDFLTDIKEFLDENESEFLILDYQHRDPAESAFDDILFGMLEEALGSERILCAPEGMSDINFVNSLTLGEARGKVLVTLGAEKGSDKYDFVMVRDANEEALEGSVLHSPYIGKYNRSSSEEYVNNYLDEYIKLYSQYGGGICVLQGQLTGGILEHEEAKHDPNMTAWLNALEKDSQTLDKINVVMRDYITSKKCADIIKLNKFKGFVEEECAEAFDAMVAKLA